MNASIYVPILPSTITIAQSTLAPSLLLHLQDAILQAPSPKLENGFGLSNPADLPSVLLPSPSHHSSSLLVYLAHVSLRVGYVWSTLLFPSPLLYLLLNPL